MSNKEFLNLHEEWKKAHEGFVKAMNELDEIPKDDFEARAEKLKEMAYWNDLEISINKRAREQDETNQRGRAA